MQLRERKVKYQASEPETQVSLSDEPHLPVLPNKVCPKRAFLFATDGCQYPSSMWSFKLETTFASTWARRARTMIYLHWQTGLQWEGGGIQIDGVQGGSTGRAHKLAQHEWSHISLPCVRPLLPKAKFSVEWYECLYTGLNGITHAWQ